MPLLDVLDSRMAADAQDRHPSDPAPGPADARLARGAPDPAGAIWQDGAFRRDNRSNSQQCWPQGPLSSLRGVATGDEGSDPGDEIDADDADASEPSETPSEAPERTARWRPSRRIVIGAVVVLAVALGAVVFLLPSESRTEQLRSAPDKALDQDFASAAMRASLVQPDGSSKFTDSTAEFDVENDKAHGTLPDVIEPGDLELVSEGTTLFLSIPVRLQDDFDGARWVQVDAGTTSAAQGAGLAPIPDPATVLFALKGVTGDISKGETTVFEGAQVTEFSGTISTDEMAKHVGDDREASVRALASISKTFDFQAALDGDGLPRRVRLSIEFDEGTVVTDLVMSGYGAPVLIGIPPDDAVVPAADFTEALEMVGSSQPG